MLSFRIRVENERGESIRRQGKSRTRKSHLLHSMFNQIDVYFNQKLVSPPNNAYAYVKALLNYASLAKTSHLTSCLWDTDIPGYMDDTLDSSNPNTLKRRAIDSSNSCARSHWLGSPSLRHFQNKFLIKSKKLEWDSYVRNIHFFCLMENKMISKNTHSWRKSTRKKSRNKPECTTRTR